MDLQKLEFKNSISRCVQYLACVVLLFKGVSLTNETGGERSTLVENIIMYLKGQNSCTVPLLKHCYSRAGFVCSVSYKIFSIYWAKIYSHSHTCLSLLSTTLHHHSFLIFTVTQLNWSTTYRHLDVVCCSAQLLNCTEIL